MKIKRNTAYFIAFILAVVSLLVVLTLVSELGGITLSFEIVDAPESVYEPACEK